jgi:hypothetical protein
MANRFQTLIGPTATVKWASSASENTELTASFISMIQSEKCSSLGCAVHMARQRLAGSMIHCMQPRHLRYE